jgi:hypothetical protein
VHRSIVLLFLCAWVVAGCFAASTPSAPSPTTLASPSGSPAAPSATAVAGVPRCEDLNDYSAPAEWYRDEPVYVANEQPVQEVMAWASSQPGFEDLWIDREHHGWLALAFSQDPEARQADLEAEFPGVGVVVVPVDWSKADLDRLQDEVVQKVAPRFEVSTGVDILKGVTIIEFGVLTPERQALVEELFAGERVCISGLDPAEVPQAAPQPIAGDGWRLLGAEDETGQPYRTGIAWNEASYEALWNDSGLAGEPPPVNLENEVAIWFGAVHGSSCPGLRLDDVVVDAGRAIVHGAFVNPEAFLGCTADAVPHSFVVALERSRLPVGPFWIQLGPEDPPGGAPEERTIVEVDLSAPGAVAPDGAVHPAEAVPVDPFVPPGGFIEPGFPAPYRIFVHCGIEWLGTLNDVAWRTDVPAEDPEWIPDAWRAVIGDDQSVELEVRLETGPPARLTATANGHAVEYAPTTEDMPECD